MNRFLLILFFSLCLFLSVHSQTYTVDNFSEFDLSLKWSAATGIRGETRNLFGLLLPVGWCVAGKGGDFTIAFSNGDTVKGQFAYCQFYSDYLSRNLETPAGYYWWGGRALDKITFSS
ncbi:MAG TPA: hypothetical protein PLO31_08045, partial [Dysgonamonadaceae bacterium]|nr:hypothetical protein [Dysgonamonadaceae bacterium]